MREEKKKEIKTKKENLFLSKRKETVCNRIRNEWAAMNKKN